jgi:hypothetical protein
MLTGVDQVKAHAVESTSRAKRHPVDPGIAIAAESDPASTEVGIRFQGNLKGRWPLAKVAV